MTACRSEPTPLSLVLVTRNGLPIKIGVENSLVLPLASVNVAVTNWPIAPAVKVQRAEIYSSRAAGDGGLADISLPLSVDDRTQRITDVNIELERAAGRGVTEETAADLQLTADDVGGADRRLVLQVIASGCMDPGDRGGDAGLIIQRSLLEVDAHAAVAVDRVADDLVVVGGGQQMVGEIVGAEDIHAVADVVLDRIPIAGRRSADQVAGCAMDYDALLIGKIVGAGRIDADPVSLNDVSRGRRAQYTIGDIGDFNAGAAPPITLPSPALGPPMVLSLEESSEMPAKPPRTAAVSAAFTPIKLP